jgi:hypothetical protein
MAIAFWVVVACCGISLIYELKKLYGPVVRDWLDRKKEHHREVVPVVEAIPTALPEKRKSLSRQNTFLGKAASAAEKLTSSPAGALVRRVTKSGTDLRRHSQELVKKGANGANIHKVSAVADLEIELFSSSKLCSLGKIVIENSKLQVVEAVKHVVVIDSPKSLVCGKLSMMWHIIHQLEVRVHRAGELSTKSEQDPCAIVYFKKDAAHDKILVHRTATTNPEDPVWNENVPSISLPHNVTSDTKVCVAVWANDEERQEHEVGEGWLEGQDIISAATGKEFEMELSDREGKKHKITLSISYTSLLEVTLNEVQDLEVNKNAPKVLEPAALDSPYAIVHMGGTRLGMTRNAERLKGPDGVHTEPRTVRWPATWATAQAALVEPGKLTAAKAAEKMGLQNELTIQDV